MSANNHCENWLIVGKVIVVVKRVQFFESQCRIFYYFNFIFYKLCHYCLLATCSFLLFRNDYYIDTAYAFLFLLIIFAIFVKLVSVSMRVRLLVHVY